MQIRVTGKHIEIGELLPAKVRSRLPSAIRKYFERDADANVVFGRQRERFTADCVVHLSSGTTLSVHGSGLTAYQAFDMALDRIEKRVRRYKRRMKNHHTRAPSADALATD